MNPPRAMEARGKMIVGALMIASLVFALVLLQQEFDKGDYRRALALVMSKAPDARWSVGDELLARAGHHALDCEPKLTSSFAGTLEVSCFTGDGEPYRFAVDLIRKQVLSKDAHTRELVEVAQRKAGEIAAAADAGTALPDAGQ